MKSIAAGTAALSYTLTVFFFSFVSAGTLQIYYKWAGIESDNLLHVFSFVLLPFLIRLMFSTKLFKAVIQNPRAWSVTIAVFLSVILEMLQAAMPTRHAAVLDLSLHSAGILLFLACDVGFEKLQKQLIPSEKVDGTDA